MAGALNTRSCDVIVVGGGHAGVEAAWAAAHALGPGGRVVLVTMDPSRIGVMSCNPAIGGLAKGQVVREIDALGGVMGLAADASGIMFKVLNQSKGPAVRGPRAQCDREIYAATVQRLIASCDRIEVLAATVDDILVENGRCVGVRLPAGAGAVEADLDIPERWSPVYPSAPASPGATPLDVRAGAVVLTTGTFMRALMHTGERSTPGGRAGEGTAEGISGCLSRLGFELGRLKTGTPPRLRRSSLDWDAMPVQHGDHAPVPFSDLTDAAFPHVTQVTCRTTHTTDPAHALVRENLARAPMFTGQVDAECGPRYCPSIEDKVVRFADREAHHVFLEPETLRCETIYCNGISTSLPPDVQDGLVRTMPGCDRAEIMRYGYAVEYDMVRPHQIDATCETKVVPGLWLAGQINGTSGYEEAAGQGLVAGVNAARRVHDEPPVRLARDEAYIGVMLDDLVTRTPREPYRLFTSRAEHRMLLRSDTADERLTPLGRRWGTVCDERWRRFQARRHRLEDIAQRMGALSGDGGKLLAAVARRPETTVEDVIERLGGADAPDDVGRVMTDLRYDGYVKRQQAQIRRQREADGVGIPATLNPMSVSGLRTEAAEALSMFRPATLGQASRLAGVTPADATVLAVAIRRHRAES